MSSIVLVAYSRISCDDHTCLLVISTLSSCRICGMLKLRYQVMLVTLHALLYSMCFSYSSVGYISLTCRMLVL